MKESRKIYYILLILGMSKMIASDIFADYDNFNSLDKQESKKPLKNLSSTQKYQYYKESNDSNKMIFKMTTKRYQNGVLIEESEQNYDSTKDSSDPNDLKYGFKKYNYTPYTNSPNSLSNKRDNNPWSI